MLKNIYLLESIIKHFKLQYATLYCKCSKYLLQNNIVI